MFFCYCVIYIYAKKSVVWFLSVNKHAAANKQRIERKKERNDNGISAVYGIIIISNAERRVWCMKRETKSFDGDRVRKNKQYFHALAHMWYTITWSEINGMFFAPFPVYFTRFFIKRNDSFFSSVSIRASFEVESTLAALSMPFIYKIELNVCLKSSDYLLNHFIPSVIWIQNVFANKNTTQTKTPDWFRNIFVI